MCRGKRQPWCTVGRTNECLLAVVHYVRSDQALDQSCAAVLMVCQLPPPPPQVGVVSFGDGCGRSGYPGMTTSFLCYPIRPHPTERCVCCTNHRCLHARGVVLRLDPARHGSV
jgi:hypothetical protein